MIQQSYSRYISEELKSVSWRGICTPMFITALAKIWKQPKCLSVDKWIKMWCVYHGMLSNQKKGGNSYHLWQQGWTLRELCWNKFNWDKYWSQMWHLKIQTHKNRDKNRYMVVTRDWSGGGIEEMFTIMFPACR